MSLSSSFTISEKLAVSASFRQSSFSDSLSLSSSSYLTPSPKILQQRTRRSWCFLIARYYQEAAEAVLLSTHPHAPPCAPKVREGCIVQKLTVSEICKAVPSLMWSINTLPSPCLLKGNSAVS